MDPKYYRPTEVDLLIGDPTKAMTKLGWKPKYDLATLIKEMVAYDIALFKKELYINEFSKLITDNFSNVYFFSQSFSLCTYHSYFS